jgi:hypothetical protein
MMTSTFNHPLDIPPALPGLHGEPYDRHIAAVANPRPGMERALVSGIGAIGELMDAHEREYGSPVSQDYLVAPIVRDMCLAWRAFLDQDLGRRLDGGAIDAALVALMARAGYDDEGDEIK